jgi:hypothetical protein
LAISVHVPPPFVEVCHLVTLPVLLLKEIVPLLVAVQKLVVGVLAVPPTEGFAQQPGTGALTTTGFDI